MNMTINEFNATYAFDFDLNSVPETRMIHDLNSSFLLLEMAARFDDESYCESTMTEELHGINFRPPCLHESMHPQEMARLLLQASLLQMIANLWCLQNSDEPEWVHQSRVGWRHFRTTLSMVQSIHDLPNLPKLKPLRSLMRLIGRLRDIDVAKNQTLPNLERKWTVRRAIEFIQIIDLIKALDAEAQRCRRSIRAMMMNPPFNSSIWALTQWTVEISNNIPLKKRHQEESFELRHWAQDEIRNLQKKIGQMRSTHHSLKSRHHARLMAKRLRYAIEDFSGLLKNSNRKALIQAKRIQTQLGEERDWLMACELAKEHGAFSIADKIRRIANENQKSNIKKLIDRVR